MAIALALVFGLAVGWVNGTLVRHTRLPSFIVTLAVFLALAGAEVGLARSITGTTQPIIHGSGPLQHVFAASWKTFNIAIVWWAAVAAIATWVLTRTRFGNWVLASGGDVAASRSAGIRVDRVKTKLFMATSFAAALVGVIQTLEFNSGDAARGQSFVFDSIIAAVIGGVLLTGGYGSAIGVCFGATTFGIVNIGVFYTGWNTDWTQLFLGVLLLLAVLANNLFRRMALSRRPASEGGAR